MNEDELYNILIAEKDKIKVDLEELNIIPLYKLKDSPDFILKINLKINIFNRCFDIVLPIPIELEKAGIDLALEDLKKLVEREKYYIRMPMLVISKILSKERKVLVKFPTEFNIKQLQEWQID